MDAPRYQRFDRCLAGLAVAGRSHRGRHRQANEDAFLCQPERGLFAVIDGMGGMAAGQVASRIARRVLAEADDGDLRHPLDRANRQIFERGRDNPEEAGMGCVATVARVTGDRLELAHVGDTRALLASRTGCEQLTRDHTVVADLEESLAMTEADASRLEGRHRVTRDLGGTLHPDAEWIDRVEVRFDPGDLLLLCSDGLSDLVGDGELFGWLDHARAQGIDVAELGDELIERVLDRGAPDDVTVVLVRRDPTASSTDTEVFRARPEFVSARHGGMAHGAARERDGGGRRRRPAQVRRQLWTWGVVLFAALLFTAFGIVLGLYAPDLLSPLVVEPASPVVDRPVEDRSTDGPDGERPGSSERDGSVFATLPSEHGSSLAVAARTVLVWEDGTPTVEGSELPPTWQLALGERSVLVLRRIDFGAPPWRLRVRLEAGARLLLEDCLGTLEALELSGPPSSRVEIRGQGLVPAEDWEAPRLDAEGPELWWPAVGEPGDDSTPAPVADEPADSVPPVEDTGEPPEASPPPADPTRDTSSAEESKPASRDEPGSESESKSKTP